MDYAPREVHSFYCNDNKLRSLKGSLKYIYSELNCSNNMIATFYEFPRIISNLICMGNPIFELWKLFRDLSKIELFNDYDMIREEYTDKPVIIMDMLNDFLLTIGRPTVEYVYGYKNI